MRQMSWAALLFSLLAIPLFAAESPARLLAIALFKDKALISINGEQRALTVGGNEVDGVRLLAANADSAVVESHGQKITLRLDGRIGANFAIPVTEKLRLAPGDGGRY